MFSLQNERAVRMAAASAEQILAKPFSLFNEQAMGQERWTEVDRYITERLFPADPALEAALAASEAAGLPAIQVSPNIGKLLHLLARSISARTMLEIGTLGGYSTIWLARSVAPGGRVVTPELNSAFADAEQAAIERNQMLLRLKK